MTTFILSNASLTKLLSILLMACALLLAITYTTIKNNKSLIKDIKDKLDEIDEAIKADINDAKEEFQRLTNMLQEVCKCQEDGRNELEKLIINLQSINSEVTSLCSKLDVIVKLMDK